MSANRLTAITQAGVVNAGLPSESAGGKNPYTTGSQPVSDIDTETWNHFLAESQTHTIFQTLPWLQSWWDAYGNNFQPWILLLSQSGRKLGWAPMLLDEQERPRTLRFIGSGNADYLDLITSGDYSGAVCSLLDQLRTRAADWDQAIFENIPHRSDTWRQLDSQAKSFGLFCLCRPVQRCPALIVQGNEIEVSKLASKYSLRRPINRLSRLGELRIRNITDIKEGLALLHVFFNQHMLRWKGTPSANLFRQDATRRFYAELLKNLLPRRWLLFTVVELDGHPLSFHFGFDYDGVVTWYKPAYDTRWAKYSPGLVLVKDLIDYTLQQGRRELDFTIGDEAFKQRYTNAVRTNMEVRLFPRRRDFIYAKLGYHARQVAKRILQTRR